MTTDTVDSLGFLDSLVASPIATPKPAAPAFALTADQQTALTAFQAFLCNPIETVFVLSGYSGCGKSTLVRTILDQLDTFMRTARLIDPQFPEYEVQLTATTNKAAENLQQITGYPTCTIHSHLGLMVNTDFTTGVTTLTQRKHQPIEQQLLFIDEASYIDSQLLDYIFKLTHRCKIVFVGDPAQLTPVKSKGAPVFEAGFTGAALTETVRQKAADGSTTLHPITALATQFRHTVNTGEWLPFKPDGFYVQWLPRDAFNRKMIAEFTRPDWRYADSKVLAWTNKCVIAFNQFVRQHTKGSPHFEVGDYANNNNYVMLGKGSLKTDQLVQITKISDEIERYGVKGRMYGIDYAHHCFMPNSLQEKAARIRQAREAGDTHIAREIEQEWIDLRAVYAQTVNKSQGSTYGSAFIDLDDIGRCNSGDQIARMLYVGTSRARHHVYLTGDLI